MNQQPEQSRILVIDECESIQSEFIRGVGSADTVESLGCRFGLTITSRVDEALEAVTQAVQDRDPFDVAFVDMGAPPGLAGLEIIQKLWKLDRDIQIVMCTEHSDHRWSEIRTRLNAIDQLLVLKKPFDSSEVRHLALALSAKRRISCQNRELLFERSTQLQEVQESLRQRNRHLELASQIARVGYGSMDLVTQEFRLSGNACVMLDVEPTKKFCIADMLSILPPKDQVKFQLLLDDAIFHEQDFEYKFCFKRSDGKHCHLMIQVTCERDVNSAKTGLFFVIRDVSEDEKALRAVKHASLHDPLTLLPNRAKFNEKLNASLIQSRRNGTETGLILLDLDRFKEVNDSYGHPVGDGLLRHFAQTISTCVRETDTVARLGGDEFAIVLGGTSGPHGTTILLDRICDAVSQPFVIEGKSFQVTFSAGVALAPINGDDVDSILKSADLALYRAKQDGRGVYRFFDEEMDRKMRERLQIETDLKHALDRDEFELHFQPIVKTESVEISAMETLIRWTHPERGRIAPDDFIYIAEDCAAIIPIGRWVLMQACLNALKWPGDVRVAVNVSAIQLQSKDFHQTLVDCLEETGLEPHRLELEITETAFLRDSQETLRTLTSIRELGVGIAMDDFGIGYSSLSYLRSFPFDKIKLDKSFVDKSHEPESKTIICAVAGMGESLGMQTCAEGVETPEQFELVKAEGYTHVQGYMFGKPVSEEETRQLMELIATIDEAIAAR